MSSDGAVNSIFGHPILYVSKNRIIFSIRLVVLNCETFTIGGYGFAVIRKVHSDNAVGLLAAIPVARYFHLNPIT